MSYVLTLEAEAELADAALFCKVQFSASAAENFLETFEAKARLIAEFPGVGTATSKGRRLFPIGRYPFSILYRAEAGVVRISAIAHHSRRPGYWQKRQ
ncbi:MAG: type II toxin-antitoxin system RelE/ParE family toxin [Rubrivivax sp.]